MPSYPRSASWPRRLARPSTESAGSSQRPLRKWSAAVRPPPRPLALRRYSGKFLVRVPPETHRRMAIEAAEEGVSLNRLASAKLSR